MYETITVGRRGAVGLVTLDRPAVRNALNAAMRREVIEALGALDGDQAVRAVVLTGAGEKGFCAGQDLKEARDYDPAQAETWMDELKRFYGAIRGLDKPSVAAVNGVAAGAGFQIALAADLRVGHAGARMGQTEVAAGLPSVIGPYFIALAVGPARALELSLTARLVDGEDCFRLGLFNHLVPQAEVLDKALALAEELGAKPPVAVRLTKRRFRELTQAGFDAAFEAGARLQREAYGSGEPQRVMTAFLDKRMER